MGFFMNFFEKSNTTMEEKENKNRKRLLEEYRYSYVTDFKDGYALAIRPEDDDDEPGRIVIINEDGDVVSTTPYMYYYNNYYEDVFYDVKWFDDYLVVCNQEKFDYARKYEEGYHHKNDFKVYLNKDLQPVMCEEESKDYKYLGNNQFYKVVDEGTIIYNVKTGKTSETKGEIVELSRYLNQDYYKVVIDNKYGYYDEKFDFKIECDNDDLGNIDDKGRVPFVQNGRCGVIYIQTGERKFR